MLAILILVLLVVLLCVAGMALLAVYLGKRSARGKGWTIALCAGIAAGIFVGGFLLDYTGVYYARPIGWTILLIALATAVVALIVLVARAMGKGGRRVLALGGLVVLAVVLTAGLVGLSQMAELTPYPWEARARQIGESAGFVPLLAGGRVPDTGYECVSLLAGPATGVVMGYHGFEVQERKAPQVMDEEAMRAIAAVGEDPLGNGGKITSPATYRMVQVGGTPALLVQWQPDVPGAEYMTETVSLLLFKAGNADVRVWSSQVDKPGAGGVSPDAGVSPEELIKAAETLQPME